MNSIFNSLKTTKNLTFGLLLAALLVGQAQAAEVGKGVMIVRGGPANADSNYKKEERDSNDRLHRVSILCASSGNQTPAALVATDTGWAFGTTYMSGSTTAVINYGGHVVKDPLPGNPNHCLINGLKLSQIKGLWH